MNSLNKPMRKLHGFSLIELMIVLVIMGVLSAIAIPGYQNYVKKANRADAQQVMLTIANKEQQYLLDARLYTDILGTAGLNVLAGDNKWTCTNVQTTGCSNTRYVITVVAPAGATPPTFTITATPTAIQSSDGILTLLSTGAKTRIVGSVDQGW